MLTPEDLKKKTFSKGFRGYETAEVDKFMQELIKEYNYLYLDNLQQKETIERVSSKLEYYQQIGRAGRGINKVNAEYSYCSSRNC